MYLAEGPHVVTDALDAKAEVLAVFVAADRAEEGICATLAQRAHSACADVHVVHARELARLADTETPQGIIAVVRRAPVAADPFAAPGLWLVLDGIQDPGNVGTLLRSAEAFGAAGAIAGPGTADFWSGKVLRSAQGAHFRLVLPDGPLPELLDRFAAAGGVAWLAETGGESVYGVRELPQRLALVLGSEARGPSPETRGRVARTVSVPHRGRAESLNVAMAGSVVLSWLGTLPRAGV